MCLAIDKLSINSYSDILHFAPENSVSEKIKTKHPGRYIGADKLNNEGRRSGLIIEEISAENIPYPDASFSGIIASHIMEHVDDDLKCIRAFHRVVQPRGWVMLLIPIFSHLLSQESSTDFGQWDHKRLYHPKELMKKMTSNGFRCVSLYTFDGLFNVSENRYNIHKHHVRFQEADMVCFKGPD